MQTRPTSAAAAQTRQVRFAPAFINEDSTGRLDSRPLGEPWSAWLLAVGMILLRGPEGLFLRR